MGAVEHPSSPTAPRPGSRRTRIPAFARGSPGLCDAYAMAHAAHHGQRRHGTTEIDHPVAVAEALLGHGIDDEEVLVAALLHDVLEDTDTTGEEIAERFGGRIRARVELLTEDPAIEPYAARKAEHRERVVGDFEAAAIYAADKLARCRQLRRDGSGASPERLEHYAATLELLEANHPALPLLDQLRAELGALQRAQAD